VHALLLAAAVLLHSADTHATEARAASELFAAINGERRVDGVPPLVLDPLLSDAALDHVADMARKKYFEHTSPDGISPFDRMRSYGCEFTFAGENIALAGDEIQADRALFKSAPHRMNTLNPKFTRVGIAVMYASDGRMLFVEDFAG
jgi:uncharacterized protein YkwD